MVHAQIMYPACKLRPYFQNTFIIRVYSYLFAELDARTTFLQFNAMTFSFVEIVWKMLL